MSMPNPSLYISVSVHFGSYSEFFFFLIFSFFSELCFWFSFSFICFLGVPFILFLSRSFLFFIIPSTVHQVYFCFGLFPFALLYFSVFTLQAYLQYIYKVSYHSTILLSFHLSLRQSRPYQPRARCNHR